MCLSRSGPSAAEYAAQARAAQPKIAAVDNTEVIQQGAIEVKLRKRRAGAANDILTGPTGIPAVTKTLGGVAA